MAAGSRRTLGSWPTRELDDGLGPTDLGGAALSDLRRDKDTRVVITHIKGKRGRIYRSRLVGLTEAKARPNLRVDFDRRLKLEFHGSGITLDAGLLAYRELDDVLGLTDLGGAALSDLRRGKNARHLLTGLLRP